MITINSTTQIDESEITFTAARSSGPGGQHVNKVNSKVILEFDVLGSAGLTDEEKQLVSERLSTRISKEGILQITSQESRSQFANKEDAVNKLVQLLQEALRTRKRRRKTRMPWGARQKRMDVKRQRSETKQHRGRVHY